MKAAMRKLCAVRNAHVGRRVLAEEVASVTLPADCLPVPTSVLLCFLPHALPPLAAAFFSPAFGGRTFWRAHPAQVIHTNGATQFKNIFREEVKEEVEGRRRRRRRWR